MYMYIYRYIYMIVKPGCTNPLLTHDGDGNAASFAEQEA